MRYVLLFVTLLAGCAYQSPTSPEPVQIQASELRIPTQVVVQVNGPSGWYADLINIGVVVYDQRGARLGVVVHCDVSDGRLEPAQWDTANSSGSWWHETRPGAVFACRTTDGLSSEPYRLTALDFEMPRGCCGGAQPKPKPPPTPPDDGESGS